MMTSLLARTLRGILALYVKKITFQNGWEDDFKKEWSETDPQIKAQYMIIIDAVTQKLASLPSKFSKNRA